MEQFWFFCQTFWQCNKDYSMALQLKVLKKTYYREPLQGTVGLKGKRANQSSCAPSLNIVTKAGTSGLFNTQSKAHSASFVPPQQFIF